MKSCRRRLSGIECEVALSDGAASFDVRDQEKLHMMRKSLRMPLMVMTMVAAMMATMPAQGLTFHDSFSTAGLSLAGGPEGIAYDPTTENLWVVTSAGPSGYSSLYEISTAGSLLASYNIALNRIKGVSMLPSGNLLVSNVGTVSDGGGLYEIDRGGALVGGGIQLTIDFPSDDPDGLFYSSATNTVFVADDTDEMIYEFDLFGSLVSSLNTKDVLSGILDPEGIAVDPVTGHYFLADASKGTRSIYELSPFGDILNTVDFVALGFLDPEGMTLDMARHLLYVADDNAYSIVSFKIDSATKPGGSGSAAVPEPMTAMLALMGLACIGSSVRRRRLA
jgi:DNA-binding beta-propeller fold protein YncE